MPLPEILAPAGSPEVLDAALDAGANAVYFGLKKLNARRGATNFLPEQLSETVAKIHAANAKAYLTLNISLTQRELGLAFRTIQCAIDAHADAILITDPALLAVIPYFPAMEFHFSTQAAVSSSAGVRAAKALGLKRVVLARELSGEEIAATTNCGIEIETFVQGAHCFSCSGRCLLSSWGGGRSGNRGACTSPCRLRWTNQHGVAMNPLSMHDMSLLPDLQELKKDNVASLKIEGRLKSPKWVREAVSLYKAALSPEADREAIVQQSQQLGAYTGRQLSNAFFHGCCAHLTGDSARPAANTEAVNIIADDAEDAVPCLHITISQDDKGGIIWLFSHGEATADTRIPPQRIANPKRAVTVQSIVEAVPEVLPKGELAPVIEYANETLANELLPKSARNAILDDIARFFRFKNKEADGNVSNVTLPPEVKHILEAQKLPCPANTLMLGNHFTHVRLSLAQLPEFAPKIHVPLIVKVNPQTLAEASDTLRRLAVYKQQIAFVALPDVIYEAQLPALNALLDKITAYVEVNSWDTWELARQHHCRMIAGPGLHVLNALAARKLHDLGCEAATVSCEIDRQQLEELSQAATTPLAITVYSHPKLMVTRAILPDGFTPADHAAFRDARNTTLIPEADGFLTNLRPALPMDWRQLRNPKVKASMLVVELFDQWPIPAGEACTFNYDRRLR